MAKFTQIGTKASKLDNYNMLWSNTEEDKIPIVDGKISFYDHSTGAYYSLYVKQVKGRGVADADKLIKLSDKHRRVIRVCMDIGWESYTSEQILKILEKYHERNNIIFKGNGYKRTISELFRRGIFSKNNDVPPKYILNLDTIDMVMKTGEFI